VSQVTRPPSESSERERRKERAAAWSIAASSAITLAKGTVGLGTGSLALISDAAHSLLDVAATTMTWLAVRAAHKPADDEHQYGHGKLESLAALVETAFLFLLSGAVALEGARRLWQASAEVAPSWIAAGVLVASIAVDAWRWRGLKRVAQETGSDALEADALHFSSDLVNSVLVLGALGAAALGYQQADALVAIGVSVFIAFAGFRLARRTVENLLDAAPKGLSERIRTKVDEVPGVVSVEQVRVRPGGDKVFGEVRVRVARTLPLEHVAAVKERILTAIAEEVPRSEIVVALEPTQLDDETILEQVLLIAAKQRLPVHHVMVQDVDGRTSLSLDLEVDGRMSLGAAHALATKLEAAIREELGPDLEVDTHIEPLRIGPMAGQDESPEVRTRIEHALAATAARIGRLKDVHSVRVRRTSDGLVVTYHCRFDPGMSVASVHAEVDELEQTMRSEHPNILRLTGHAEPIGSRPH
jgi:cation diffusion facilitator family transporter